MAQNLHAAKAQIWAVLGSSGSGKGVWVKSRLRAIAPARLLVWDYLDEYSELARRCVTLRALALAVVKAGATGYRYRYVPRTTDRKTLQREFDAFCQIAWACTGSTVVVEELSAVTTPSYAPRAWAQICNMGRHRGMHVIGISQFPAQMDKAILGNATLIHTGALRQERHRKAIAEELDIDPAVIAGLAPLEYIERDFSAGGASAISRGSVAGELTRRRKTPVALPAASPTGRGESTPSKAEPERSNSP
ncbi:MAG TPA: hypothetical protein VED01_07770 [Burkholderiales bacterium]|nr:hypothetical protein [Burkholderiales bacterium]